MIDGKPTTQFQDYGAYFDLAPQDAAEDVRRDIVLALTKMGFEIEMSHHEVAESQHEIDFKYGDALVTADHVITFKFATKALALSVASMRHLWQNQSGVSTEVVCIHMVLSQKMAKMHSLTRKHPMELSTYGNVLYRRDS